MALGENLRLKRLRLAGKPNTGLDQLAVGEEAVEQLRVIGLGREATKCEGFILLPLVVYPGVRLRDEPLKQIGIDGDANTRRLSRL